ncbi:MAG: hypothetical protein ACRDDH_20355 [Cetobacterium sp.]|uniref:hypothetical protein n=1 Tax=Cetobacterium sp. TaxID=2071632 RepID=UPI003EE6F408
MEKLQNKNMVLNFLTVATYKGLINQDIRELEKKIDKNISVLGTAREDIECKDIDNLKKDELKKRVQAHNKDLNKIMIEIENNISEYKELVKERYLEFGAVLREVEEEYIN